MLDLQSDLTAYENDINDIFHIFSGYFNNFDALNIVIKKENISTKKYIVVKIDDDEYIDEIKYGNDLLENKRREKRIIKFLLYKGLSKISGHVMPWGSLTGVRPAKLVYDRLNEGYKLETIPNYLVNDFGVSESKANLICDVVKNQLNVNSLDNQIDLYINIPICPTRCSYCSFISSEYDRCKKYIDDYVLCLVKELNSCIDFAKSKGYVFKNIYMGGGTPTTLSCFHLRQILECINFDFKEFTVECGRPDTITYEKLELLKEFKVNRISINPQTLNDKTLEIIGRKHTSGDFFEKFEMARKFDFVINTDLIAGLPNENFDDFKYSLNKIIDLKPDDITVHTMAIKNASILKQNCENISDSYIQEMVDYSFDVLSENGYKPYYLYRQKNMLGLYENVGYYKDNCICDFNVESMEEKVDILACGAGAISKRIFKEQNRIERVANVKQIQDYIARIDEMIDKKVKFFN